MRQFLAVRLTPAWHDLLDERRAALSPALGGWRWLRREAIHLTLRFLGDVEPGIDAAARPLWAVTAGACDPFEMRLSTLGTFPRGRRPRVLWAGIAPCRELERLAAKMERAAREAGFAAEDRAFRPHLTLARARRGARPDPPPEADRELAGPSCPVREMILFQSVLDPSGARYTALESYPLAGGG